MYGIFTYIWPKFMLNLGYIEHLGYCIYLILITVAISVFFPEFLDLIWEGCPYGVFYLPQNP